MLHSTIIQACFAGRPLAVYNNGTNSRDWLYVEDHCAGIDAVLHRGRVGNPRELVGDGLCLDNAKKGNATA